MAAAAVVPIDFIALKISLPAVKTDNNLPDRELGEAAIDQIKAHVCSLGWHADGKWTATVTRKGSGGGGSEKRHAPVISIAVSLQDKNDRKSLEDLLVTRARDASQRDALDARLQPAASTSDQPTLGAGAAVASSSSPGSQSAAATSSSSPGSQPAAPSATASLSPADIASIRGLLATYQLDREQAKLDRESSTARIVTLEARIVTLEAEAVSSAARIVTLEAKASSSAARIVTLEAEVVTLEAEVVTLEAEAAVTKTQLKYYLPFHLGLLADKGKHKILELSQWDGMCTEFKKPYVDLKPFELWSLLDKYPAAKQAVEIAGFSAAARSAMCNNNNQLDIPQLRAHWAPSEDVDPHTQQPRPVSEQLKRDVAGYALEVRAVDGAPTGQEGLKQLLRAVYQT